MASNSLCKMSSFFFFLIGLKYDPGISFLRFTQLCTCNFGGEHLFLCKWNTILQHTSLFTQFSPTLLLLIFCKCNHCVSLMCHVGSNDVLLLFCLSSLLTLLQQCAVQCTPATAFWPFCVAHPFTHVMWLFPSNQSAVLKHNTVNFGMLYSGGYAAPHASRSMTINFYNNTKHENQTTQWLPLPNVSMKDFSPSFSMKKCNLY